VYHSPLVVVELAKAISQALEVFPQGFQRYGRWSADEGGVVLRVFKHASDSKECIVSVLEPPMDQERASRVRIPWSTQWEP
jgi:hypothetical protein